MEFELPKNKLTNKLHNWCNDLTRLSLQSSPVFQTRGNFKCKEVSRFVSQYATDERCERL